MRETARAAVALLFVVCILVQLVSISAENALAVPLRSPEFYSYESFHNQGDNNYEGA